jgi:hypothetical protein
MPRKKPLTELTGLALTDRQQFWLDWLTEKGGSGVIDGYGRVQAGGETSSTGAMIAWLMLVQKGYVVGHKGRLYALKTQSHRTLATAAIGDLVLPYKGPGLTQCDMHEDESH